MSKIQENREVRFILAVDKANDNLNQVAIEIAKNNHSKDDKQSFKFFLSELDNALKAIKNDCGSNVSDLFKEFGFLTIATKSLKEFRKDSKEDGDEFDPMPAIVYCELIRRDLVGLFNKTGEECFQF